MTTPTTRLLRILHHKDANTIVLVNVSAQKADLLELNLLATEGEAPYSYKGKTSSTETFHHDPDRRSRSETDQAIACFKLHWH